MKRLTKNTKLSDIKDNESVIFYSADSDIGMLTQPLYEGPTYRIICLTSQTIIGNSYGNFNSFEDALKAIIAHKHNAIVTTEELGQILAGTLKIEFPLEKLNLSKVKIGDTVTFTYNEKQRIVNVKLIDTVNDQIRGRDQYEPKVVKRFNISKIEDFVNLDNE